MGGHSRSMNGVPLAYDPAIHPKDREFIEERWMAGSSPGMTNAKAWPHLARIVARQTDNSSRKSFHPSINAPRS